MGNIGINFYGDVRDALLTKKRTTMTGPQPRLTVRMDPPGRFELSGLGVSGLGWMGASSAELAAFEDIGIYPQHLGALSGSPYVYYQSGHLPPAGIQTLGHPYGRQHDTLRKAFREEVESRQQAASTDFQLEPPYDPGDGEEPRDVDTAGLAFVGAALLAALFWYLT